MFSTGCPAVLTWCCKWIYSVSSQLYSGISFLMPVSCELNQSLILLIDGGPCFLPDTSQALTLVPYLYSRSPEPADWSERDFALWGLIEQFPPTNSTERKSERRVCSKILIHSKTTTYRLSVHALPYVCCSNPSGSTSLHFTTVTYRPSIITHNKSMLSLSIYRTYSTDNTRDHEGVFILAAYAVFMFLFYVSPYLNVLLHTAHRQPLFYSEFNFKHMFIHIYFW